MNVAPKCSQSKIEEKEIRTRRKRIEPKETRCCLILCLLLVFTRKLEILVTTPLTIPKAGQVYQKGQWQPIVVGVFIKSEHDNWNSEWWCTWSSPSLIHVERSSCPLWTPTYYLALYVLICVYCFWCVVKSSKKRFHLFMIFETNVTFTILYQIILWSYKVSDKI